VVPASWGDELIAGEVIRRCAARENRPAIQCSCPRVAERLGAHASKLDDSVLWLTTPPVAAAQYIRAHATGIDVHITYAGACPGAIDTSIDQRITPTELLVAISSRGIELSAQPTVFENIIPPDRRRHYSAAAGLPEAQRLWENAAFRVAQPTDIDLSIGVAQLLLGDDRVLIDIAPSVGCICRAAPTLDDDPTLVLRSPSPVVREGVVEIARAAPVIRESAPRIERVLETVTDADYEQAEPARPSGPARRQSQKIVFRRQAAWRRQTPRPGAVIVRPSSVMVAVSHTLPLMQRPEVRVAIATAVAVAMLLVGVMIGRSSSSGRTTDSAAAPTATSTLPGRSRSP
jgi:hypothetical protein